MIVPTIIILSILLILLLIDWEKVLKRVRPRSGESNKVSGGYSKNVDSRKPLPAAKHEVQPKRTAERLQPLEPTAPTVTEEAGTTAQSPEVQELLSQADIHFRKGELKAAEQIYLKAAAKDPKCSKAYSRLGVIYLENGEEYDDAEAAFRQALKTDATNGYVLNNLGLVLYHQDKFAEAIRYFEQAVRQDENNATRHANLGKANMAMRQYAKAESAFKRALKLAPNELEYKDLLGEAVEKKQAHKALVRR